MKVSMVIQDMQHLGGIETITSIYVNNKCVLSEVNPTVYEVLLAVSNAIDSFKLDPLIVQQELAYTGEQYLGAEYAV